MARSIHSTLLVTTTVAQPGALIHLQDMVLKFNFQQQMQELQALLHDHQTSEFVIVSIPTYLSLTEAERLLLALQEQRIRVRRGVLNRIIGAEQSGTYLAQMSKGQQACLAELRSLSDRAAVSLTEVPYFDAELRAVYGLRAMGAALFNPRESSSSSH